MINMDEKTRKYFTDRLCDEGETLEQYEYLFDDRDPEVKRGEFAKIRNEVFEKFKARYGEVCMLHYGKGICDLSSGFEIDHIIPIASNEINKAAGVEAGETGKVHSESYGSNDERNLILACHNCNGHKKHKMLSKRELKDIFKRKEAVKQNGQK